MKGNRDNLELRTRENENKKKLADYYKHREVRLEKAKLRYAKNKSQKNIKIG